MNALLLVAIAYSLQFKGGHTQVVLTPVGEVNVCIERWFTLRITCTAYGALWTTSGFDEGLPDRTRVPALVLANSSSRVTTYDQYTWINYSTITLSNFSYDDHGATVTCESHYQTGQQSVIISVDPPNCSVSLTASRLTANKSAIHWVIGSCLGALPTTYSLWWYPIGKPLSQGNYRSINSSTASDYYYTITGLLSNTKYFIGITLRGQNSQCAAGGSTSYSAISETLISASGSPTLYGLVAVTAVQFLLLLTLAIIFVVVCKKLISAKRKKVGRSGGGGGGQELSVKNVQLSADKEMNQTPEDHYTLMNLNPAYQSRETAVHTYP